MRKGAGKFFRDRLFIFSMNWAGKCIFKNTDDRIYNFTATEYKILKKSKTNGEVRALMLVSSMDNRAGFSRCFYLFFLGGGGWITGT